MGSAAATKVLVRNGPRQVERVVVYKKKSKSRRGPRGPRRKRGPAGPKGAAGINGAAGSNGAPGAPGPSAARIDYSEPGSDGIERTVATFDGLTMEALCSGEEPELVVWLESDSAATVNATSAADGTGVAAVFNDEKVLPAGSRVLWTMLDSPLGTHERHETQAVYRSATETIGLQLHMIASDETDSCQIYGTAVPAT